MTPPIWLDAAGRRRPTRACWTCGREVAVLRLRAEHLRPHGWQPGRTLHIPAWCGARLSRRRGCQIDRPARRAEGLESARWPSRCAHHRRAGGSCPALCPRPGPRHHYRRRGHGVGSGGSAPGRGRGWFAHAIEIGNGQRRGPRSWPGPPRAQAIGAARGVDARSPRGALPEAAALVAAELRRAGPHAALFRRQRTSLCGRRWLRLGLTAHVHEQHLRLREASPASQPANQRV